MMTIAGMKRVLVEGLYPVCEYDIGLVSNALRDLTSSTCWCRCRVVLETCCLGSKSAMLKTVGEGYFRTSVQELEVVVDRGIVQEKDAIQCWP